MLPLTPTEIPVFVIVGLVVVFGSILFGYTMHHGHVGVLLQWSEFIIIGGAAGRRLSGQQSDERREAAASRAARTAQT